MIEYVIGTLVERSTNYAIVECFGLGFYVHITRHTYDLLPEPGTKVKIFTELSVKDNSIEIYGFHNETERELFRLIRTVPGIGDRLAISILSCLSAGEFVSAIEHGSLDVFSKVPSLGRKRAERLIHELKEKIDNFKLSDYKIEHTVLNDALSAMLSLGYKKSEIISVLENILRAEPSLSLEELLRKALLIVSKR